MCCRMNDVDEDYKHLVEVLNARLPKQAQKFSANLHKVNLGSLLEQQKQAQPKLNRHLAKYLDCGEECFDNARKYYANDFQLLQYPMFPVRL